MLITTYQKHHSKREFNYGRNGAFTSSFFPKLELTKQQSQFRTEFEGLEADLLNLSHGNFLGDVALMEQLLNTKSTATTINCKVRLLHQQISLSNPPNPPNPPHPGKIFINVT